MDKKPAIIIPASETVFDDYIVCMFDGVKCKMMHRHVRAVYGMTWDEYKAYCKLPDDYPATAPKYSREKSQFAAKVGLGSAADTVDVKISRDLMNRIAPLALNESMTKAEFIQHILIEHILSLEARD